MMVMPANQTNELVHLWSALYGNVGHLYTPARKERIRPWLPYVLDNGRYADTMNGIAFDEDAFVRFVESFVFREIQPLWIAVPDVPFNGEETLDWWEIWAPRLRSYDVPLALVVQNGMTPDVVVPLLSKGDVIFVGGSTEWKWATVESWASAWDRIHVGRVNSPEKLTYLKGLGVESCDGSGWFRGKSPQVVGLGRFLAEQAEKCPNYAERCAISTRYANRDQLSFGRQLEQEGLLL